ncbi:Proteasome subunit beta type-6 [Platanthera guangdongensis]|uniref:Proteasome subunit beta type-6 n=1 Tax=Platanthera guangdongensis TaxID=2320717 RepID=A0ABR2N0L2_9ASPA
MKVSWTSRNNEVCLMYFAWRYLATNIRQSSHDFCNFWMDASLPSGNKTVSSAAMETAGRRLATSRRFPIFFAKYSFGIYPLICLHLTIPDLILQARTSAVYLESHLLPKKIGSTEGGQIYSVPLGGTVLKQPFTIGEFKNDFVKASKRMGMSRRPMKLSRTNEIIVHG